MLMPIVKELFLWLYGLFLDMIGFCANSLLSVMATDLTYFEKNVQVRMSRLHFSLCSQVFTYYNLFCKRVHKNLDKPISVIYNKVNEK